MLLKDLKEGSFFRFKNGSIDVIWQKLPLAHWMTGLQHCYCTSLTSLQLRRRSFSAPLFKFAEIIELSSLGLEI